MSNKKRNFYWLLFGVIITAVFLVPVFSADYSTRIIDFTKAHPTIAPAIVMLVRFLTVVVAPLPGASISFASIVIFPWWEAWLYNVIGAELAATCAFFIARKFREPAVARFAPIQKVHAWQERISRRKQFLAFVGLRFVALSAFDFVSYAAGLSKLPYRLFLAASLVVDVPMSLLFFFVGGVAFRYSVYIFSFFVLLSACGIAAMLLKKKTPLGGEAL